HATSAPPTAGSRMKLPTIAPRYKRSGTANGCRYTAGTGISSSCGEKSNDASRNEVFCVQCKSISKNRRKRIPNTATNTSRYDPVLFIQFNWWANRSFLRRLTTAFGDNHAAITKG